MEEATKVKERPILFSGPMVNAILQGKKTQTRRVITKMNSETAAPWDRLEWDESKWPSHLGFGFLADANGLKRGGYLHVPTRPHADDPQDDADNWTRNRVYPKWDIGDHLWVRETFSLVNPKAGCEFNGRPENDGVRYRATWMKSHSSGWKPSIFMPRWASRITLEIADIRPERLQDITEEDARAEGFSSIAEFKELWNKLNAKRGFDWNSNCWVWVNTFLRIDNER